MRRSILAAAWLGSFLVFLFSSCLPAVAQEKFGSFSGIALDQTGAVVPGVSVTVTSQETGRVITTSCDESGAFSVRNVDPGHYSVRFQRDGFNQVDFPNLT